MVATRRGGKRQQSVRPDMPGFVEFVHPKLVAEPPVADGWLHEIKFDGYRVQVRVQAGQVTIFTRNGHDWTAKFPELAREAAVLPDCILDGELCALDDRGRADFSLLRSSISPGKTERLVLFAFDLLWRDGEDMRPYALASRKAVLEQILRQALGSRIRSVSHFDSGGKALAVAACRMGLEGVVSKRRDAPYRAGRSEVWLKAKCRPSQEVVIGGWKQAPGGAFESLLVGVYDHGRFTYAGSVKTGFGPASKALLEKLKAMETQERAFAAGDPPRKTSAIHWTKPELVANLEIAEWTASGKLRQSSFKGLREDKRPEEVVREQVAE